MNSEQYEELCRLYIATQFNLDVEDVQSVKVPDLQRPDLPAYEHQIDLYWETGGIANAKWRGSGEIDQPDVLLLQQVRQQVAAHKAFVITNQGFTSGAKAAADDHGIALNVVAPTLEAAILPSSGRVAIQEKLNQVGPADRLYSHSRGTSGCRCSVQQEPSFSQPRLPPHKTRVVNPPSTKGAAFSRDSRRIGKN